MIREICSECSEDFGHYVEGQRDEYGGAKSDWAVKIQDLEDREVDWNSVRAVAKNRSRWRTLAAHCPVKDRRI